VTQPEHPPIEQISDLVAGLLPAAEALALNSHLAACPDCTEERTALLELSDLLAGEGASGIEMPPEVAATLDAAIARASSDRAAQVRSIAPGSHPWRWLAGAAAAVLVVGVGFAGLRALPQGGTDTAASTTGPANRQQHRMTAASGTVGAAESDAVHPPTSSSLELPPAAGGDARLHLTSSADVAAAGRLLSARPALAIAPGTLDCAEPPTGGVASAVSFEGQPAVLSVSPNTHLATVYDCATATRTLLVTGY